MARQKKIQHILGHPNVLTLIRIAAAPVIVVLLFFPESRVAACFAGITFSIAAITDYLDGFFARRWGLVSNFGKAMDPLADKLLVSSSLIMLTYHARIPGWIVCIIVGRELAVTGLRGVMAEKGEDVSASNLGKYKTGFQIAAIIPLLLHFEYFGLDLNLIGLVLLYGALFFTLWSGIDYFVRFRKIYR